MLETWDGRVAAFEVKAGTRIKDPDLDGLRLLRDRLGDRFAGGFALNLGDLAYRPRRAGRASWKPAPANCLLGGGLGDAPEPRPWDVMFAPRAAPVRAKAPAAASRFSRAPVTVTACGGDWDGGHG